MSDFQLSRFRIPDFAGQMDSIREAKAAADAFTHGHAHVMHEELMKQIRQFETTLKPEQEVGAMLSSFGQRLLVQIEKVSYRNPFFIIFHGFNADDGSRVQLVQHTSQISVLFVAVEVPKEEHREARRIGFESPEVRQPQS